MPPSASPPSGPAGSGAREMLRGSELRAALRWMRRAPWGALRGLRGRARGLQRAPADASCPGRPTGRAPPKSARERPRPGAAGPSVARPAAPRRGLLPADALRARPCRALRDILLAHRRDLFVEIYAAQLAEVPVEGWHVCKGLRAGAGGGVRCGQSMGPGTGRHPRRLAVGRRVRYAGCCAGTAGASVVSVGNRAATRGGPAALLLQRHPPLPGRARRRCAARRSAAPCSLQPTCCGSPGSPRNRGKVF
jgi:hypothetical protein